jgi:hypothetical protein
LGLAVRVSLSRGKLSFLTAVFAFGRLRLDDADFQAAFVLPIDRGGSCKIIESSLIQVGFGLPKASFFSGTGV